MGSSNGGGGVVSSFPPPSLQEGRAKPLGKCISASYDAATFASQGRPLRDEIAPASVLVEERDAGKDMKKKERTKLIFQNECAGDFWDSIFLKLEKQGLCGERMDAHQVDDDGKSLYIFVFGFRTDDPGRDEISDIIKHLAHVNEKFGDRGRTICVIPHNGELQRVLRGNGANEIINKANPEHTKIAKELTNRIQLMETDFENSEPMLTEPIICRAKNDNDSASDWTEEDARRGMAQFAVQVVQTRTGHKKKIDRYGIHMGGNHELARDFVRGQMFFSQYMDMSSMMVLDIGCGEGHPGRSLARKVFFEQIRRGERDFGFILGIDNNMDSISFALKKYEGFKKENADLRLDNGGKRKLIVPTRIDLRYHQADFFKIDPTDLEAITFEELGMKFGRPDVVMAEYIAHWIKDRESLVRHISDFLPEGGLVACQEEIPLKITPGSVMTQEVAQGIHKGTFPMDSITEYLDIYLRNGFIPLFEEPLYERIDPPGTPQKDVHGVYGMVFKKTQGKTLFSIMYPDEKKHDAPNNDVSDRHEPILGSE